jgi:hypothetical protein
MIKLHGPDNKEMMAVNTLTREGDVLIIKGKIFGTMPLTAKLYPEEARAFLKMLNFKLAWFLLTLPFRRSVKQKKAA